jgi:hypothetical protein
MKQGILLAPGMEINYVAKDGNKWDAVPAGGRRLLFLRSAERKGLQRSLVMKSQLKTLFKISVKKRNRKNGITKR